MNAAYRQLYLFQQLLSDHLLVKQQLADQFDVDPRAIQRDFHQLKTFIADQHLPYQLRYRRKLGGYQLVAHADSISKPLILTIVKILLASRALTQTEMATTINGLLRLVPQRDQRDIQPIISNERLYYQPVHHGQPLLQRIWELSQLIPRQTAITINYHNRHHVVEDRTILPQAVIFSEYYFYLVAYTPRYQAVRYYRIDRISDYHRSPEKITRNRAQRVEEGHLRHYLQYMQPGDQVALQFEFFGIIEAALDRFPTAKVLKRYPDGRVLIEAETIDTGAQMWLLSQGPLVKVVAPASLVAKIQASLRASLYRYH